MTDAANPMPLVALVGIPNVGKTALFNRLTGQNARVGNYPGITVDRRLGRLQLPPAWAAERHRRVDILDVPGTYSLSARSAEEQIALDAIVGLHGNPRPDLVVIVLDATQLARNLYLALQIVELGLPVLLALNMIDDVGPTPPDHRTIAALFGVPCVPTSARTGFGLQDLRKAIAAALREPAVGNVQVAYPPQLTADARSLMPTLPPHWYEPGTRELPMALWALASIDDTDELVGIEPTLRANVQRTRERAASAGRDLDAEIIIARYSWIDAHQGAFYRPPDPRNLTERVDRVLLHPIAGFAFFLGLMFVVFQALFSWSDPAIGVIETVVAQLGTSVSFLLPPSLVTDLLVEGVIGGVGNVVVFLPQILLLFGFIGLLEDSGYMARAAYLMDRVMRSLGLHGRAFVPMLSGFACAVPAIMATRTMERQRDRVLTMMVVPLTTCSARLPVYTLIIAALFPPSDLWGFLPVQGLLMTSLYLFGVAVALAAAGVLGRTVLKGERVPLILELPPYRLPTMRSVLRMMWERSKLFLTQAGTVILACTVLMWVALSFPRLAEPPNLDDLPQVAQQRHAAAALEYSAAGRIGKAIEPAIAPLGFDWKIGVGILGAFSAREVFVSTMGIVYGVGADVDEESPPLRDRIKAESHADGRPVYTPLVGLSLLVFFALASQCMSTLAVVKRETGGWRWPTFMFVYMTSLAWVASFAIYQGGRVLGLE